MIQRVWTNEEDEYLKKSFGIISYREIAEHLNCSVKTMTNRAKKLGIKLRTIKNWTFDDIEYLKENINKINISDIQKELNVDYYQIMDKLDELGLKYISNRWTIEEEEKLKELAPKHYISEIAKLLNRTESSIINKAKKLGINYTISGRIFTNDELEYIKKNWGIISVSEIARKLNANRSMIEKQADILNLSKAEHSNKKWTDKKIKKLKKLANNKTITELASIFKTTNNAISYVASKNNIKLINSNVHWSKEDICCLKEYAKTMDLSEITKKMNKSAYSIRSQAKRQNIKIMTNKNYANSIWTDENSKQLKELVSQGKNIIEIVKIMNKKDCTLLRKAKELEIKIQNDYKEWTEEDTNKLIELSKTKTISELVLELERLSQSIYDKARSLGINIISDCKKWTEEDYEKLKYLVMIEKRTTKEISEIMGRTEESINKKIYKQGLKNQTGDKKLWTEEEEIMLSDLWGNKSMDLITKKLNRTASSISNKAYELNLGSQIDNNYDGLTIPTICKIFNVSYNTVSINWVALGLKLKSRKTSNVSAYFYVEINDLFKFLEANQNIWDSRYLEVNILGIEPEWLKQKRISDENIPIGELYLKDLTKQQLINAKKIILEQQEKDDDIPKKYIKNRKNGDLNG